MGSYALPALDIKPPQQQPNQLEQLGQLLQAKNMIAEQPVRQQILQQQAQSGQLENQQRQQGLNDQKAMTIAMQQWDGKDVNQLVPLVIKNGASANAVMGLKSKVLEQQQAYSKIAADDATTGAKNLDTLKGKNDQVAGALSNLLDPKAVPDDQLPQAVLSTAQDLQQKGLLDPQHAQVAQHIAQSGDPATIRQQLGLMQKSLMSQTQQIDAAQKQALAASEQSTAAKNQAETNYYNKNGGAPGVPIEVQQQNDWLAKHPGKGPADFAVAQAGAKAGAEERARMPGEMALAAQRRALSQGDPGSAAQLLVNGDATLSELKARGATPDFIARTLFAANKLSGGKYNAQSADAQFKVAQSPTNVAFFGSAKSLTDPGGTLDQLSTVGKTLPQNQIPAFNSIADWEKAATGNGPMAHYAATALGVADDYAKVMGGGQGSDTSRLQALNLIKANASPEARAGAGTGIRNAVTSQVVSRIGKNSVLQRMYGDIVQPSAPSAAASPQTHTFSLSAWQRANPKGDSNAARAAAQQQGYQVVQ